MCVCVLVCVHPTPARYIELLLTLIKDPDMPPATLQIPVVAEHDVKGPLMVESGGGTLYHAVGQFEGFLYKKVKYDHDMERVWGLQERWVLLQHTVWASPVAFVSNDDGCIVGYVMRKARGKPLWQFESEPVWSFPLQDTIRQVVLGMRQAVEVGIFPMIEHGGNVLAHVSSNALEVALVDADGCPAVDNTHTEAGVLGQLETVFLNFARHPFAKKVFDYSGDDPKIRAEMCSFEAVLSACGERRQTEEQDGGPAVVDLTAADDVNLDNGNEFGSLTGELAHGLADDRAPADDALLNNVKEEVDSGGGDAFPDTRGPRAALDRGDIEVMWEPDEIAALMEAGDRMEFDPEEVNVPRSILDDVQELRGAVERELETWPRVLSERDQDAIRIVALRVQMDVTWDQRSDLLCARMFALLQGADMRAHEEAVYLYSGGHFSELSEIPGHKISAMESALARAATYFYHLMDTNAPRGWDDVFDVLAGIDLGGVPSVAKSRFLMRQGKGKGNGKGLGDDVVAPGDGEPALNEDGRWWGEAGWVLFGVGVKFARKCDTTEILQVYHAWCRQERPAANDCFDCLDACIKLVKTPSGITLQQVPKSVANDCYVHIPVSLAWKPADADIQRLRRALCTGYAGQPYGRKAVTAMECLSLLSCTMPQLCIVLRGRGRNMKSGTSKLRANTLGTGHKFVSSSVLHVPEEMRKQLLHFCKARCITIKECKGACDLEEDVSKNLFGRDELAARLLFGKITAMFILDTCGMFWEMNMVPPRIHGNPHDIASLESWWRRFLIIDLESSFVPRGATVSPGDRIFENDYSLTKFLASKEAALIYLRYFLLPFMAKHSESDAIRILEEPPQDVIAKTQGFVAQMANGGQPLDAQQANGAGGDPAGTPGVDEASEEARRLVERVHAHYDGERLIRIQEIERTIFIPGTMRPGKRQQKSRADNLHEACLLYPYLLKRQFCKPLGFRRLNLDIGKFRDMIERFGADKFGDFENWGITFDHQDALQGRSFTQIGGSGVVEEERLAADVSGNMVVGTLLETVNLERLKRALAMDSACVSTEEDKKALSTMESYIRRCESEGTCYGHYCDLSVEYYLKFGMPGRRYPHGPALAKLKKCYRALAVDNLCFYIDQKNAVPSCAWTDAQSFLPHAEDRLSTWRLYQRYPSEWRAFLREFYELTPEDAKINITKIFSLGLPAYDIPFLWSLASDVSIFKDAALRAPQNQHLQKMFMSRKNPEATRLFYAVSPKEDSRTQELVSFYRRDGLAIPMAYIFDAAILTSAAPPSSLEDRCHEAERELGFGLSFEASTGPCPLARRMLVASLGCAGAPLVAQGGELVCLWDAVSFLTDGDQQAPDDGPFSVRDFNLHCGHDSQRESETVWLSYVAAHEVLDSFGGGDNADAKRRRASGRKSGRKFVCRQPYGDTGHFFALLVRSYEDVTVADAHMGVTVTTNVEQFIRACSVGGVCELQFFSMSLVSTQALPDMSFPEYDLVGGGSALDDDAESEAIPTKLKAFITKEISTCKPPTGARTMFRRSSELDLIPCPFCVTKRFDRTSRFEKHLKDYHADVENGSTSGKILRLCKAEFDRDELRLVGEELLCPKWSTFKPNRNYLARAIGIVREWNAPALARGGLRGMKDSVDRRLRWVLTENGPKLLLPESMRGQAWHAVSKKVVVNTGFALRLLITSIQPGVSGKQRTTSSRLIDTFLTEGEPGAPFVPYRFDTVQSMQKKALDLFDIDGRFILCM